MVYIIDEIGEDFVVVNGERIVVDPAIRDFARQTRIRDLAE